MATSLIPKSNLRKNESITVGYATVPVAYIEGRTGWAMPDGSVTYCTITAQAMATKLNNEILRIMKNPKQLLKAN